MRLPTVAIPVLLMLSCTRTAPEPDPSVDADHAAAVAQNPEAVTFTAGPPGGRRRFAQGESIEIELSFSTSKPDTYSIDPDRHPRHGPGMTRERFRFDPANGVVDPLQSAPEDRKDGSWATRAVLPKLGDTPTRVTVALDEWARFEAPGKYRMFVQSSRVSGPTGENLTSNVFELEIVSASDPGR